MDSCSRCNAHPCVCPKLIWLASGDTVEAQELLAYANAQYIALQAASEQIQALVDEVEHLKKLLAASVPVLTSNPVEIIVPQEQSIAEVQLARLHQKALQGDLTLEETRKYDLLVKNLYLAKGQSTTIVGEVKRLPEYSEAQLLDLAGEPSLEEHD